MSLFYWQEAREMWQTETWPQNGPYPHLETPGDDVMLQGKCKTRLQMKLVLLIN